jgi:hypothetical protein
MIFSSQMAPQAPVQRGIQAWYAPDSIINTGGKASAWNDKTTNAYHVSQVTDANRPVILTANLNGYDVLEFAQASQRNLTRATTPSISNPITLTGVIRSNNGFISNIVGSNSAGIFPLFYVDGVGTDGLTVHGGSLAISGAISVVDRWVPFVATCNGASSELSIYNFNDPLTGNAGAPTLTGIQIGRQQNVASNMFDGRMAELTLHNVVLTTDEKYQMTAYYNNKYGLAGV